jgi:hypothetical protein
MGYPGIGEHNLVAALWQAGALRSFYAFLFDFDDP